MTLRCLRDTLRDVLLQSGIETRETSAMVDALLEDMAGITRLDVALSPQREMHPDTVTRLQHAAARVADGEPLQYVTGKAWFHGLSLQVGPGVLIPRPETSQLVDIILDSAGKRPDLDVLDVCTGSGAIAVALARDLPFAHVTATDIAPQAITTARANATALKVNVQVTDMNVLKEGLPSGRYDIIVSNPPYIIPSERSTIDPRVVEHEPALALFVESDDDPLLFYRAIARESLTRLKPGGKLFFEINPLFARQVKDMLLQAGYNDVRIERDYKGNLRFAIASL